MTYPKILVLALACALLTAGCGPAPVPAPTAGPTALAVTPTAEEPTPMPTITHGPTPTASPAPTASPTPAPTVPARLQDPRITVYKAERRLELWDGGTLVAAYPVGLGWEPAGPKEREGDGRTPEGDYFICLRNGNSRFYLSLGLSYPNEGDARRGLDDGLISGAEHDRIVSAIRRGERPPWNTALGGEIMIHGGGAHSDWTAGCVAVDNAVMDVLWRVCPVGTPVTVRP